MKKTLLMAGVTALALTTTANATTLGTPITIHPQVDLVGSFGLSPVNDLKFGVVIVPDSGMPEDSYITVTPSGTASGNVQLLGGNLSATAGDAGTTTVSAGTVAVTGAISTLQETRGAATVTLQFDDMHNANSPVTGSIALYDDSTLCGTVQNITTSVADITEAGNVTYGGTLNFEQGTLAGKHCVGTGRVTLVFTE